MGFRHKDHQNHQVFRSPFYFFDLFESEKVGKFQIHWWSFITTFQSAARLIFYKWWPWDWSVLLQGLRTAARRVFSVLRTCATSPWVSVVKKCFSTVTADLAHFAETFVTEENFFFYIQFLLGNFIGKNFRFFIKSRWIFGAWQKERRRRWGLQKDDSKAGSQFTVGSFTWKMLLSKFFLVFTVFETETPGRLHRKVLPVSATTRQYADTKHFRKWLSVRCLWNYKSLIPLNVQGNYTKLWKRQITHKQIDKKNVPLIK